MNTPKASLSAPQKLPLDAAQIVAKHFKGSVTTEQPRHVNGLSPGAHSFQICGECNTGGDNGGGSSGQCT